mmetsp:Transcript_16394/g.19673  ORF Transcript_16394/g.19673 Transcript_16394/m.19673 type:complete len:156 (+) Transcript_16394:57-524(+)
MFKRITGLLRPIQKHFTGKTLVGSDKFGNKYVFFEPHEDSKQRRMIECVGGVYDKDKIHKLWSMWLNHTRDDPPTEEDLEDYDRQMEMLAVRVKKVEEEDARKRLEERMERGFQEDSSKASSVNVSGMFEAMNTDQDQQKSSGGKFKPDGWTPDK